MSGSADTGARERLREQAEALASTLSLRALRPREAEDAVNLILALAAGVGVPPDKEKSSGSAPTENVGRAPDGDTKPCWCGKSTTMSDLGDGTCGSRYSVTNWTSDGRYTNSSEQYLAISAAVAALIRNSAHSLIRGGSENVGRLIVAQLAHVHGLAPASEASAPEGRNPNTTESSSAGVGEARPAEDDYFKSYGEIVHELTEANRERDRLREQLDAAESDLARAEQSKLALAQMWHDQAKALKRALEVVAKYHRWLERVEAHRIPGAYMGLDHAVGENVDGCSGCAALGVVGPPPDEVSALGQTASETRGGDQ